MYVAVGQFAVTPDWQVNAQKCVSLMAQAQQKGAAMLVLPEALLPDYHRLSQAERERAERLAAEAAAKKEKA